MEVPRSCLRADAIANEGDLSNITFDTDSLTMFMYGFDEADSQKFLGAYMRKHILSGRFYVYTCVYEYI